MGKPPSLQRADVVLNLHLQRAWRKAVALQLDPYLAVEREGRVFAVISSCDPSREGKYLPWLSTWRLRCWERHGFKAACDLAELERLALGLDLFHTLRPYLPAAARDINRYTTSEQLLCVENLITIDNIRNLRKAERDDAYSASEMLFDDGTWKLVLPRSQSAAQWWGRGTRWCTSARWANRFASYTAKGPLLILLTPAGRYQLAVATGEFRDAADRRADVSQALQDSPQDLLRTFRAWFGEWTPDAVARGRPDT